MTALTIVRQRDSIHVATDGAMYRDGVITSFGSKVCTVPHWPGVISTVGNGAMSQLFGWLLGQEYRTFDDAISSATDRLPTLVSSYDFTPGSQLFFVGVSEHRGPEAWMCSTDDYLPPHIDRAEAKASGYWAEPFQLQKLPDQIATPVPSDQVERAGFEGFDLHGDTEALLWSLKKHLEMQRHTALPDSVGGIGGFAQCTSIYPDRIEQRILCRWDDKTGGKIRPAPLDWKKWHKQFPKPKSKTLRLVGA